MKKKILTALICAALALNLTACANNEEPDDTTSKKDKSSKSSVTESVTTPSDSENKSSDSAGNTDTSSTADSKPEESKPEETSTPAGSGIDWDSVPYADELDFMVQDYEDGVLITEYLGSEAVLKIPETIGGKKVIALGRNAFGQADGGYHDSNTTITDIHMPSGMIRSLGFVSRTLVNLKSVALSDNFAGFGFVTECPSQNTIYTYQGKTYRLPEDKNILCDTLYPGNGNVQIIDGELRKVSITLKDYVIPDDITSIRNNAFENCDLITNITIPGGVKDVGHFYPNGTSSGGVTGPIFVNCPNLETVTLAEGVTTLTRLALDCPNLSTVNLPSTLTKIENAALGNLSALKNLTLPDGITSFDEKIFWDSPSSTSNPPVTQIETVTYKGITYKPNQFPNLIKAINGN